MLPIEIKFCSNAYEKLLRMDNWKHQKNVQKLVIGMVNNLKETIDNIEDFVPVSLKKANNIEPFPCGVWGNNKEEWWISKKVYVYLDSQNLNPIHNLLSDVDCQYTDDEVKNYLEDSHLKNAYNYFIKWNYRTIGEYNDMIGKEFDDLNTSQQKLWELLIELVERNLCTWEKLICYKSLINI